MCKKHLFDLTKKPRMQEKYGAYEERYRVYFKRIGIDKSCHIPREQGRDISLMTEIVFD